MRCYPLVPACAGRDRQLAFRAKHDDPALDHAAEMTSCNRPRQVRDVENRLDVGRAVHQRKQKAAYVVDRQVLPLVDRDHNNKNARFWAEGGRTLAFERHAAANRRLYRVGGLATDSGRRIGALKGRAMRAEAGRGGVTPRRTSGFVPYRHRPPLFVGPWSPTRRTGSIGPSTASVAVS
jgi:hypothetical protein